MLTPDDYRRSFFKDALEGLFHATSDGDDIKYVSSFFYLRDYPEYPYIESVLKKLPDDVSILEAIGTVSTESGFTVSFHEGKTIPIPVSETSTIQCNGLSLCIPDSGSLNPRGILLRSNYTYEILFTKDGRYIGEPHQFKSNELFQFLCKMYETSFAPVVNYNIIYFNEHLF